MGLSKITNGLAKIAKIMVNNTNKIVNCVKK